MDAIVSSGRVFGHCVFSCLLNDSLIKATSPKWFLLIQNINVFGLACLAEC